MLLATYRGYEAEVSERAQKEADEKARGRGGTRTIRVKDRVFHRQS